MKVQIVSEDIVLLKECELEIIPIIGDLLFLKTVRDFTERYTVINRLWNLEENILQLTVR